MPISAGNATTLRGASKSYNADNQISGSGFVFDGNGCPTTYNGTNLGYDPEMRMTSYGSNFTAVYRYDGLRAWKQTSSGKTCFYYDGDEPIFETDGSGNLTAINVFAPDGLVARQSGGTWTQYSFDAQGNVDNRLDSSGNVLSSPTFDAYGAGAASDVFGYNGQWGYYSDSETGLYLLGERYYDAAAGRFVTSDPIDFDGGINPYSYCGDDPVAYTDSGGDRKNRGKSRKRPLPVLPSPEQMVNGWESGVGQKPDDCGKWAAHFGGFPWPGEANSWPGFLDAEGYPRITNDGNPPMGAFRIIVRPGRHGHVQVIGRTLPSPDTGVPSYELFDASIPYVDKHGKKHKGHPGYVRYIPVGTPVPGGGSLWAPPLKKRSSR